MFTGIIEEIGEILNIQKLADGSEITIKSSRVSKNLQIGDSIAVDGACQTVVRLHPGSFTIQAVGETIQKTTLGKFTVGRKVNLETPLTLQKPLGGHLIQGHICCTGRISQKQKRGENYYLEIELPPEVMRYCIAEGSIAVDGISLTIARLEQNHVGISLIPHTMENTTLSLKPRGDEVNIETDLIARYLERFMKHDHPGNININQLKIWGY